MTRRDLGDGFELDDDKERIDLREVHRFLCDESYWAAGRPFEVQERLVARRARVVGLYQNGSARSASAAPSATAARSPTSPTSTSSTEFRGRGLGEELVREMIEQRPVRDDAVAAAHDDHAPALPQVRLRRAGLQVDGEAAHQPGERQRVAPRRAAVAALVQLEVERARPPGPPPASARAQQPCAPRSRKYSSASPASSQTPPSSHAPPTARRRAAPGRAASQRSHTSGTSVASRARTAARRREYASAEASSSTSSASSALCSPAKLSQNRAGEPPCRSRSARAAGAKPARSVTSNSAVGRMRRDRVEEIRPRERRHQRAVAARRLPLQRAPARLGQRREALVDERHDLVAEVGAVAPDARRVDPLRAADRRPAVDEHDDRLRLRAPRSSSGYDVSNGVDVEPRARRPHVRVQDVDRRVAPRRVGRRPDEERPLVRIAERVPRERLRRERQLLPGHVYAALRGCHGCSSRSASSALAPSSGIRSCSSVSRSRSVTVPSASVCSSIVSAHGVPISSWRR